MKKYIDYVKKYLKINNTSTIIVYDSFRKYFEESVKTKFCDKGIDLAVISSGLTSICQLLNLIINKLFKDNLYKEWHIWMAGGGAGITTLENLHYARLSNIYNEDSDVDNDINSNGNYE
ncbi:hypothetical protein C1646_776058 [Rhizophagus diaphanus]|nr:hypothetical protein C1646_776058 [Rhizophagus diaphanus] [Rhizophagus sp. MUCL 43196]